LIAVIIASAIEIILAGVSVFGSNASSLGLMGRRRRRRRTAESKKKVK